MENPFFLASQNLVVLYLNLCRHFKIIKRLNSDHSITATPDNTFSCNLTPAKVSGQHDPSQLSLHPSSLQYLKKAHSTSDNFVSHLLVKVGVRALALLRYTLLLATFQTPLGEFAAQFAERGDWCLFFSF